MNSTTSKKLKIACGQMQGSGGDVDSRFDEIASLASRASKAQVKLLILPEMSLSGYSLKSDPISDTIPGECTAQLTQIARNNDLFIVAGMTEAFEGHKYNVLILVGPDGLVGVYRKLHISSVEGFVWRKGNEGSILECDLGRIGLGICADMLFPTPWRSYRDKADLLVIAAGWPNHQYTHPSVLFGPNFIDTHLNATADVPLHLSKSLGVPVALANACGSFEAKTPPFGSKLEGKFAGRSCIVDQKVVSQAGEDETLIFGDVVIGNARASLELEPWIPAWSSRFRATVQKGDTILASFYSLFYKKGSL